MRSLLPKISEYAVAPQSLIQHLTEPSPSLPPSRDRPLQPQVGEGNILYGEEEEL